METKKIKELKRNELFTLKPIAEPSDNQVYIRGEYDRETKKYICEKFSDMNTFRFLAGNKEVYVDFIF